MSDSCNGKDKLGHPPPADGDDAVTRGAMKAFWQEHCTTASLQDMMLDANADVLNEAEKPEIQAMMPDLKGLRVLELGAGIGLVQYNLLFMWNTIM